jgi:hypothetical protein
LPPGEAAVAFALVPGERGVDETERAGTHLGGPDDAHRLSASAEDDAVVAGLGQRLTIALVIQEQSAVARFGPWSTRRARLSAIAGESPKAKAPASSASEPVARRKSCHICSTAAPAS